MAPIDEVDGGDRLDLPEADPSRKRTSSKALPRPEKTEETRRKAAREAGQEPSARAKPAASKAAKRRPRPRPRPRPGPGQDGVPASRPGSAGRKAARKRPDPAVRQESAATTVLILSPKRLTDGLESFNTRHPFCISTTTMPARAEGRVSSRRFAFSPQDLRAEKTAGQPAGNRSRPRGSYRGCQSSDQQARRHRAAVHPRHRPEEGRRDHGEGRTSRRSGACRSSPTGGAARSAR